MNKLITFPNPEHSDENGIVYVGGELNSENILKAYSLGIFPWPHGNLPLLWFCPHERGLIEFENFKIPRSVTKELKKKNFKLTFDQDFAGVIQNCAERKRPGQKGTWITKDILNTYKKLFSEGHAHSVECWSGDELVGGLYGVYIQNVFSAESMFFKESGASKACLIALVERLKNKGRSFLDIQMVTPIAELFGGEYVERKEFLKKLKLAQKQNEPWD